MKASYQFLAIAIFLSLVLGACSENPRSIIRQASSMVCRGEANPEAATCAGTSPHPLVILRENGDRHQWDGEQSQSWFPASATETQLVACVGEPVEVIEEVCQYDGPDITRYRYQTRVQLFEARSAELVFEQTFIGSMPRECGSSEDYDLTEIHGNEVTYDEVEAWLQQYVESTAAGIAPVAEQQTNTPIFTTQPAIKEINVFCGNLGDSPQYLASGQQVTFYWRWGAENEEYRQAFIDAASFELFLDDQRETIATLRTEDMCAEGGYCATWKLSSPMTLGTGSHEVMLSIYLENEITDGFDLNQDGQLDLYGSGIIQIKPACEVIAE